MRPSVAAFAFAFAAACACLVGCGGSVGTAPAADANEEYTPLVQSVPTPPRWFTGSDGKRHLVHELHLINGFPVPIAVTAVEVLAPDRDASLASLSGDALTASMSLLSKGGEAATTVPPASIGVVWFDVVLGAAPVPERIVHRVTVQVPPGLPVPEQITSSGAAIAVDTRAPVVLGAPLRGAGWVAVGSCCDGPHRRSIQPINNALYLGQRFAIDFNLLDAQNRIVAGDPKLNASTAGFGQPVIAVADATVAAAVDAIPDQSGDAQDQPITLQTADGNHVILDLGEGRYAFYAHLQRGSVAVRQGEAVRRGQQIGKLGNSGSTTGAHLHFHVMDRPSALVSDGLPYVFDAFELSGRTPPLPEVGDYIERQASIPIDAADAGPRRDALPLGRDVIAFAP